MSEKNAKKCLKNVASGEREAANGVRMCTSRKLHFFHPSSFCFRTCYIVNLVELQALPPVDLYLIFEKLSSTNWIFSLKKSISKLILQATQPVRNRLTIQFIELDFSKLIFQKSSTYRSTGGYMGIPKEASGTKEHL